MTSKAGANWLEVLKPGDSSFEKAWDSLCARQVAQPTDAQIADVVERMSHVRAGGDRALRGWTRSVRGLELDRFELIQEEWDAGCEAVDAADRAALGKAAMRIREFQRKRVPSSWEMREEGGGSMGQRVRPLSRVAIVAAADGVMTATDLIMKATPASAVEVPEILFGAPTDSEGRVCPELLMAARIAGVHRIYKLAGPEAVAAFAYGTGDLPRVDKVV
ncbi:histidinol dehydrogenase, partial [Myxococcota bacterium]|nr:histidinol dehydrogenase [Myxococcota bacterium]